MSVHGLVRGSGGAEIWLYDGQEIAWSASQDGYRLYQIMHRMYSDRQKVARQAKLKPSIDEEGGHADQKSNQDPLSDCGEHLCSDSTLIGARANQVRIIEVEVVVGCQRYVGE